MVEVTRSLGLIKDVKKRMPKKKKQQTSKESEAEKKKLRKELEKVRKQHTKATKALDDFTSLKEEARYPIDDSLLQEDESSRIPRETAAAARIPDITKFQGLPPHVMPDVLVAWDFLRTFTRAISVNPISLQDFIACLNYKPPNNLSDSDALAAPPIYLGEAHLGLLKLLLADKSSDDWWWSILETPVTENAVAAQSQEEGDSSLPLIKVDFALLLSEKEDPLITTSWLQALRPILGNSSIPIKTHVKTAMGIVDNKFVMGYLKKAIQLGKSSGPIFMRRAVVWLVLKVREARPDLQQKNFASAQLFQQRAKVVEEVSQQMDKLSSAVLSVDEDDLLSDAEDSDDESEDEEEEEPSKQEQVEAIKNENDDDERPASYIPLKPPPALVDLLLPPGKPIPPSELLNPLSWPHLAGAAACRILHRYKRLRNEVDDSLRFGKELPRLSVKQRREREAIATSRVFTEFALSSNDEKTNPCQDAVQHLCGGGNYLDLSALERLCILRILMEAAYDTARLYEIVNTNHKQRTSAVKGLETEQRRAKREAKEKHAANEHAARQDLASIAKHAFLEEKRDEIRKANEANHELSEEEIDALTEEDIIEFDDDIKADFEVLPRPESFKKTEVVARVAKILETRAFETEQLTVLNLEELVQREQDYITCVKENLQALGGEDALLNPELDRDIARGIEKLRRELNKIEATAETLPQQREQAIDQLKEAIADGTIKSLRAGIRVAKSSKLFGKEDTGNGIWALNLVRDAHMELETAKQLKRVADAQKDLIVKRNKCFIRTEPLGSDRFRNRFWKFETDHVWTEVDYIISSSEQNETKDGFLKLLTSVDHLAIGHTDIEHDFSSSQDESFQMFSRQEYHSSGKCASLAKRAWGCQVQESSLRNLTKGLDSRGIREDNLKKKLKEALEEKTITEESKQSEKTSLEAPKADEEEEVAIHTIGDDTWFVEIKGSIISASEHSMDLDSSVIDFQLIQPLTSGIGQKVRVRTVVDKTKDNEVARYEIGSITGWKIRKDTVTFVTEEDEEFEPQTKVVDTPVWRAWITEKGTELWLTGIEVVESICRYSKWTNDISYFEPDAAFLCYRNALGRHFGRAAEACQAMTPIRFTQFMVKREAEIYQKLKHHVYDNSWGGKNGSRNAWITSMRDYAFDFETAREGLLTLENALLELTGGFADGKDNTTITTARSGQELLNNPITREDIELESLEKGIQGLWNSRESRAIFLEIVKGAKTVGFLGLAMELVCRNTSVYMEANKISKPSTTEYGRSARRSVNAWEQHTIDASLYGAFEEPTTRRARRGNVDYSAFFS
jgi:hypothetical protein